MNLTEEQLRFLVENSMDAILLTIPDGRILAANPAACALFGRTEEEIIKIGREGLIDTADPRLPDLLESRRVNKKAKGELNFKRKDGSIFPCEMTSAIFSDTSGNMMSSIIIRDISHSKSTQTSLQDAVTKLEESEKVKADLLFKLNEAQHTAKIGSWEWNFSNRSLWWSDELYHIFEVTPGEFIPNEEYSLRFVHPDDLDSFNTRLERALNDRKEIDFDFRIIALSGCPKFCNIKARTEYTAENVPLRMFGTIMDVSDRKRVEESLMASEERFRTLFEHNLSVMLLIDPSNGAIVDANHAAESFYGWKREQMVTMRIQDINTLGEGIVPDLERARTEKQTYFEFCHRRADGTIRDVEIFCSRIEILGRVHIHSIVHDITERKNAEKQLHMLNRAMEQSPVSVIITDREGKVVYVNPMFTEVTGYSFEEVIGRTPDILRSPAYSKQFFDEIGDIILSGKVWRGELLNKKKNGELFWEKSTVTSILNNKGEILSFIAIMEDITPMKKLNQELIHAKEKAEESDALKTAFLHNMSHEIRTPVNAIVGFSEFLASKQLNEEKKDKFIQIIIESSNQLLKIINDIISMATLEAGQEQIIERNICINSILAQQHKQYLPKAMSKSLDLRFFTSMNDEQATLLIDDNKLSQILSIMIDNAIKFTPQGFIHYGYTLSGKFIEFYVKDSGIGIPNDIQDKIFDRFVQGDNSHTRKYGGSGLGLAIADAYTKLLGGEICLKSVPHHGSEFYFTIPYKQISPAGRGNEDRVAAVHSVRRKSILIVEDEEFNYFLLEEVFRTLDAEISWASDGQKAVDICNSGAQFDLILMDLRMPNLSGFEAIKQIRLVYPDVPIIVQTAYTESAERQKAFESGCNDFISKPFNKTELLEKVRPFLAN